MPKPRPLTPSEAKQSLAQRMGGRVDRLRQFATKFGVRPYRVFLTWVKWSGTERGEGDESVFMRKEILPTPKVDNLDTIALNPYSAGTLPMGSVRVSRISVSFTEDELSGRISGKDSIKDNLEFFYEIVEDGRGDNPAHRQKYRLSAPPFRQAGKIHFVVVLDRIGGDDMDRDGTPKEPDC